MKRSLTRAAGGSCAPACAGYTLAMRRLLSPLSLALLALSLAACGNKGPLVLPSPPAEAEIVPDDGIAPDPAESADEAADDVPTDDTGSEGDPETETPPPAGTPDRSGR